MDTNKMRDQFETWLESSTLQADLSKGNHGSYRSTTTHWLYCAWVGAWNASREAVVVKMPGIAHEIDESVEIAYGFNCALKTIRADIEAQGLKVAP